MHILTNILRSKGNQTMKLGQLIEYNKRNIYLQKLCGKWHSLRSTNPSHIIFNHLNEHKFRHNFRATIDPMWSCGLEPKTTFHYLLHCNLYSNLRTELLNEICALNPTLKNLSHEKLLNILLYGWENFSFNTNKKTIKSTIKFLKTSERFIGSLFELFI